MLVSLMSGRDSVEIIGWQLTILSLTISASVARIVELRPYMIVSQPKVFSRLAHAVPESRGESSITVYPSRLRAKKVIAMSKSDKDSRAMVAGLAGG